MMPIILQMLTPYDEASNNYRLILYYIYA